MTAETEFFCNRAAEPPRAAVAWVPGIWRYETLKQRRPRQRLNRNKAFLLWQEIQELPVRVSDVPADHKLLELALKYKLAVYDPVI